MKNLTVSVLIAAVGFWNYPLAAQETSEVESLRKQLQEMQRQFERNQKQQQEQIEALTRKLDQITQSNSVAPPSVAAPETNQPPAIVPSSLSSNSAATPFRIGKGNAYLDIGLVGTFALGTSTANDIQGGLELGGHDPNQRGFTVQGIEAVFSGAVDPYFRGNANLLFSIDAEGESFFELEEAWVETVSLPWNLQFRVGQFLTDFGRQNPTHPHSWAFVDTPLVLGRMLGPDGLRNPGARISWLTPTPFYSELTLAIQDSQGETAFKFRNGEQLESDDPNENLPYSYRDADNDRGVVHVQDLLFTPRYAASFDLTDSQTLLLGTSAAFGPNSRGQAGSGDTDTQIYGMDLTWKWKSPNQHGGFPFVTFQTEALLMKYKAGTFDWDLNGNGVADEGEIVNDATGEPAVLTGENLTDYGFYSQVLYGFKKGWVAGFRVDYVNSDLSEYEKMSLSLEGDPLGPDPQRARRWRFAPNLTWYPTEFSKIRLQYNYDDREVGGVDHSVWLQFEFLLGAHAAHKF